MLRIGIRRGHVLVATLAAVALIAMAGDSLADPIPPGIDANGLVSTDTSFGFGDSGDLIAIYGGVENRYGYADGSGLIVLAPGFPATGDGLGIDGETVDAEFATGIDFSIDVTNNSLTETYRVTFGVVFENVVGAFGEDSYADSEFVISTDGFATEEFFTDLVSDTWYGNTVDGFDVAGFGGELTASGSDSFFIDLAPGANALVEGFWTMEGGAFGFAADEDAYASLYATLTIDSVENLDAPPIPEPGSFALLAAGIAGLVVAKRRRRKRD
jgi:hypothetical protein